MKSSSSSCHAVFADFGADVRLFDDEGRDTGCKSASNELAGFFGVGCNGGTATAGLLLVLPLFPPPS